MANIIITGANQGIGYYLDQQALNDGNIVGVLDIELDHLAELKKLFPDSLFYYKAYVCDELQIEFAIEDLLAKIRKIDIAIHNACLCTFNQESATDISVYKRVFDVNYFGALRFVKKVLPYMQKQKYGKVIFTSSGVGITGFMGISPYASTKGALEALAKCLNIEYASDRISFHIIHPPLTRTNSSAPLPVPKDFMASPQKVGAGLAKHITSKRFIICHNYSQKTQILFSYIFPIKMGKLMSKMAMRYMDSQI